MDSESERARRWGSWPWAILATALLLQIVPLFTTSWLPFVDVPPHVGEVAILADFHDPGLQMDHYYDLGGWLHPYTPHRVMLAGLAQLTGPMTAYRIFAALYFLLVPLALVLLLRRNAWSPWPATLGLLALYSFPLHFGFVAYCVASAVLLLGLLALERWLEAPTLGNRVATFAMPTLLFLLHPQPFLYWSALAPLFVVWRRFSGEGTLGALGPVSASLLPGWLLFLGYAQRTGKGEVLASGGVEWVHPLARLEQLPMHLGALWRDPWPYWIALAVLALWLGAALLSRNAVPEPVQSLWSRRYQLALVALLAGAMLLPESFGQAYIASRLPSMALLLLPLAVASSWRWNDRRFVAAFSVLVLLWSGRVAWQMQDFERESAGFGAMVSQIPAGSRVRCNIDDPWSRVTRLAAYRHFCSYILAEKGGLNGFLFRKIGIDFQEPWAIPQEAMYYWQHDPTRRFDFGNFGDRFDYYVVRAREDETAYDGEGPLARFFEPVAREETWRLYRRVGSFAEAAREQRKQGSAAPAASAPLAQRRGERSR